MITANPSPKRSNIFLLTTLIIISLLLGYFVVERNNRLIEMQNLNNENIEKSEQEIKGLKESISELKDKYEELEALSQAKEKLIQAIDNFQGVIGEVDGEINTDVWVRNVNSLISAANNSINDLKIIEKSIESINTATDELTAAIKEYKSNKTQREQDRINGIGTVPREALNNIDSTIGMSVVTAPCNSDTAVACVTGSNPKHVQVAEKYLHYSYNLWYMIMMHEYAHTVQLTNYDALSKSESFQKLFGKDLELQADCMAEAVIGEDYFSTYSNTCTPEQLASASNVWNAKF